MEFYAKSKVYIQTDTDGRILRCEGQYTLPSDLDGWTLIDEGYGDKYNLAQTVSININLLVLLQSKDLKKKLPQSEKQKTLPKINRTN